MKNFISILLILTLVSTLSAQCANLSNDTTWGTMIVNDTATGILYVNEDTVLCTDTYYLVAPGAFLTVLQMNASSISLDCNDSVLDGVDGTGYGISFSLFGLQTGNTVGNCTVANYDWGFVVTSSNDNILIDNVARNTTTVAFRLGGSSNNTLINNTAYNNTGYGFIVTDFSENNTLIDNVAFSNFQPGFFFGSNALYNNLTNAFAYNQSDYIYHQDTGGPTNNLTNFTIGYNETVGLISFGFINASSLILYEFPLNPSVGTVYLQPDFVSLKDTDANAVQANVSANITISTANCSFGVLKELGFPVTLADIQDTGTHYVTTLSCADGIARFNVSGFSGYALGEESTYLSLSILPDTTVIVGTETNVSCNASNSEANLTLYRDGVMINSSFSYVQEIDTLPQGTYIYECNASGNGNYSNATASGTLQVVTCTNISSPMEYTLTYDLFGNRTYSGGIIDACVYIESSDVSLNCDGYSITGIGSSTGIYVSSLGLTNVTIENCTISNYSNGVSFDSSYGSISNNDIANNSGGGIITAAGTYNNYSNNLIHNNTLYGIAMYSSGNILRNNSIYDSVGATAAGLYLAASYNEMFNNTFFNNYYGLNTASATYNNISENQIVNNTAYGLYLTEFMLTSNYNVITNNTIANNSVHQIAITNSADNYLSNNLVNASGSQGVIESNTYEFWNSSKTLGTNIIGGPYMGGNFYSNYTGVDTDGDGLGNTPYVASTYSSATNQDVYSFEQASSGAWTTFANTYDLDWSTYGTAEALAEGYYNFTIPAGASTAIAIVSIKTGGVGGIGLPSISMVPFGTMFGTDCLSTDPLQVKVDAQNVKGTITAYVSCWDYGVSGWTASSMASEGDGTAVDIYELNTTFQIVSITENRDYLPLTNNLNYAPNITIISIGGQANNSEISDLTPDIVFNATDADNSTLNCTVYVDAITPGGTNDTVQNGTLTTITLSYSLTAGQAYSFTVNCSDNTTISASGVWTETVPSASTTSSSSNPSQNEPLSIVAEDEVPAGSSMEITVERDGEVTLPNAHVVITFGTDTVFTGYTDSWGRVSFTPENAGLYTIRATKLGYVAANDSFTAVATECASNDDCAYNEKCEQGACTEVPEGECGKYTNHAWEDYECCSSSDCGEDEQCTSHECVQREPTPGCSIDTQCQQGYRCASGTCVQVQPTPECVEDGDCQTGFRCSGSVCVEVPTSPGGNVTGQTGEPSQPSTQGGPLGAILNLWWLWLILIALVAWYLYRKNREKKA